MPYLIKILSLGLLISNCLCTVSRAEDLIQVPAAIQISSKVSDGKLSILEIINTARRNNIKVVILTDRDFMRWEYGLWPLRRIIKKTVEANSIATYGIKRYLKEIEDLQKKNPDLIIIAAVESAPFYYWSGNPLQDNFTIHDWHKHILVIGLEKASDYQNLPSVSNSYGLLLPFTFKDIYHFWPILTLLLGILYLRKRRFDYRDFRGQQWGPYARSWQISGIILMFFSLLFLFNGFPFRDFKYDQYHGEQGIRPYQNFINYVNEKGGLTFWAHPEAEYITTMGRVNTETREHTNSLLEAHDYTGFAVFYEGYKKVAPAGGIWDEMLRAYCQGRIKAPVWAIGGLSFDQDGDLGTYMKDLRTVLLIPDLTKQSVLKAIKEGKMYVVRGAGPGFILDKFMIKDSLSDNQGTISDEVILKGKPIIKISGSLLNGQVEPGQTVKVKLIRNGKVIQVFEVESPFSIDYPDDYFSAGETIYYRLEIQAASKTIVTNPVFVRFIVI